jgi:hypothetical protein
MPDGTIAERVRAAALASGAITVTTVAPNTGPAAGGTALTLTGVGLTGAIQVYLGGGLATNLVIVSDTSATVITPAATPGVVGVAVFRPDRGGGYLEGGFTYLP